MYLGVIFLVDVESGESFSLSRELVSDNKKQTYDYLCSEAHADPDNVDTILVLESQWDASDKSSLLTDGPKPLAPKVVRFWRAGNGDFEGL